jgi:mRNA-degrading endonuclease RelE of RelBE toxin-antitoxin system
MKIVFHPKFYGDVKKFIDELPDYDKDFGRKLYRETTRKIDLVEHFPKLYARYEKSDFRRAVVLRNYGIFYEIANETVIVYAFLALRRSPRVIRRELKK